MTFLLSTAIVFYAIVSVAFSGILLNPRVSTHGSSVGPYRGTKRDADDGSHRLRDSCDVRRVDRRLARAVVPTNQKGIGGC